ncbi:MAG TPA: EamA family transporter [Acidobacteriaceae bacterium]|jgi:multidrug transporter EmrE-like cation transporter
MRAPLLATWIVLHGSAVARSWICIVCVAALAIAGECLIAGAMRRLGDLDALRIGTGLRSYLGPICAVLSSPMFLIGALCMALNFFAMLFTLSLVDLSLAAPAIGSITYVGNAIAAKLFLHENVDRRRWLATSFLAVGVVLVSR